MIKVASGGVLITWKQDTAHVEGVGIILISVPNYPQTIPRAEVYGPLAVIQGLNLITTEVGFKGWGVGVGGVSVQEWLTDAQ